MCLVADSFIVFIKELPLWQQDRISLFLSLLTGVQNPTILTKEIGYWIEHAFEMLHNDR